MLLKVLVMIFHRVIFERDKLLMPSSFDMNSFVMVWQFLESQIGLFFIVGSYNGLLEL